MKHSSAPQRKKHEKASNHERWVVSYADLLTLLLATFVVLYASSSRDNHKQDEVAASFIKAFQGIPPAVITSHTAGRGVMQHQVSPMPKPVESPARPRPNAQLSKQMAHQLAAEILSLQKLQNKLQALLQPLVAKHEVSIASQPLTLTIQLDASVLFPSGQAALRPAAVALLNQVGAGLTQMPPQFTTIVQGYTDDQPIDTAQFPSNWSLSAERSVRVVELFLSDKVNGHQLAAEGFGQFSPIADNSTDTGRAQNRRVIVVVHAPDPVAK